MKKIENIRTITTTIVVTLSALLLVYIKNHPIMEFEFINHQTLNLEINYQLTVVSLALFMIGFIVVLTGKKSLKLLNVTRLDGKIIPERFIGIIPNEKDTWKNLGINFSIMISVVTAIVIYFQVYQSWNLNVVLFPNLVLILILAFSNSFVEEVIFRFSFAAVVNYSKQSQYIAQGLSAFTFGAIHYFGVPSGIPGVLMAGFIGWFLTKSIIETKGFFWAWFIHFIQDVIIMFGLYMMIS